MVLFYIFISIFLFVTLLHFFPLVTSLTWLRFDVHWTPTIVNCWREPYVLALGDSGQVPCGPPSLQSCLGSHLGYAVTVVRLCVTVWLSPTRCALAVPESINLASRVFCILIMFFITLRFYTSGLGLRWPSSWARLAQVSATRQRFRCHRFGTLLRWGFRFLSRIRLRCFDYSRVTRVRVLLTFYPTSLRSLRILASLRVTHCDSLLLAYPHVFLTCGTFLEFVGFFLLVRATVALASIATKIIAPILLLALRSTALLAVFFRISRFSR